MELKEFQKELAKNKVYDAWFFVNSLSEQLNYMSVSKELVERVYSERLRQLDKKAEEIFAEATKDGKVTVKQSDLQGANIKISELQIEDGMFLRKTIAEFFHYARVSIDILFQIINAALFGDKSTQVDSKYMISYVNNKIDSNVDFSTLKTLLDNNKNDLIFKYLQAFDNYTKHIKTILVSVNNSFMFGDKNEFYISEFTYKSISYPSEDALLILEKIENYVLRTINTVLDEVRVQLPNCLDVSSRIHDLSFKIIVKNNVQADITQYVSFFIDVQNDISELPSEIRVYPLIIKPNDEIYDFKFNFPKIFIKKAAGGEETIVGIAELKSEQDSNELYRVYEVRNCNMPEYIKYITTFVDNYPKVNLNWAAMTGTIVMVGE
ncbi:MAG: hypothetical protein PHY47_19605 [Lachnospiraceae bacterium]|nr:hypothetical protein [Lachnospiraceae bacterium]